MGFTKVSAILLAVAAFYGYELSKIYVPEGFERPYLYRSMVTVFRLTGMVAKTAARFNIGDEVSNFRNILTLLAGVATKLDDPDVVVEFQVIENEVPVRIYSPKSASASAKLPLIIYYHGGGYVFGSPEAYELFLFEFVKKLNVKIVSVDYRMAPEYPYPIPTEECYLVTKHIMQNPAKFKIDPARVALMGDSAGGNAVAALTQRMLAEKLLMPKLQVLIYPWLQLFDHQLPSYLEYWKSGLISTTMSLQKMSALYVGFKEVSEELESAILFNNHTALVSDKALKQKIMSHLDVSTIPGKYKAGKQYYKRYDMIKKSLYPERLDEGNIFKKNKRAADLVNRFTDARVSPLLADDSKLVGLPKAYFIVLEWDGSKDEGLLYAERLRKAGVHVDTGFYEDAFHGIITFTHPVIGFQKAYQIRDDMVKYLKANL